MLVIVIVGAMPGVMKKSDHIQLYSDCIYISYGEKVHYNLLQ